MTGRSSRAALPRRGRGCRRGRHRYAGARVSYGDAARLGAPSDTALQHQSIARDDEDLYQSGNGFLRLFLVTCPVSLAPATTESKRFYQTRCRCRAANAVITHTRNE
jgi:hypothetical protein